MDIKKTVAILDVIFDYWHKTVGLALIIAAFWGLFTNYINEKTFTIMVAAVVSLKWVWKPHRSGWVDMFAKVVKTTVAAVKSLKK